MHCKKTDDLHPFLLISLEFFVAFFILSASLYAALDQYMQGMIGWFGMGDKILLKGSLVVNVPYCAV